MTAPADPIRLRVRAVELFERDTRLRLPFRFGVITLTEAPQAFVRVEIEFADGRVCRGCAAEMLAPKWFDKNPALSNDDNFTQLRTSLAHAAEAYRSESVFRTAFDLFASHYRGLVDAGRARGLNALIACYGPALLDRAVIDAAGRASGRSFQDLVRTGALGIEAGRLAPDLAGFAGDAFLAALRPRGRIAVRHTIGMADPIVAGDVVTRVGDGLPETLDAVIDRYGVRHFKIKVSGQFDADLDRLGRIAAVLDRIADPYVVTLDGNEQFADIDAVTALCDAIAGRPVLSRVLASTLFIEQPVHRDRALLRSVDALARRIPLLVDESDDAIDVFPRARARGYSGISSKACKGLYKSILNAMRCAAWNGDAGGDRYFLSAEDLTTQAGISVQQDLALVALLGIAHAERNGHHYVNGMAGAPEAEQQRFLDAHPALYERSHGSVRLAIRAGELDLASLGCVGFAGGAEPDWTAMRPMTCGMA